MDLSTILEGHEKKDDIINYVEGIISKMKNADKNSAKFKNEYDALNSKIIESGVDLDNIGDLKSSLEGKTELEKTVALLNKKLEMVENNLKDADTKREKAIQERNIATIVSEFSPELKKVFGNLTGEVLTKQMIADGKFKLDETGSPVYENDKGVFKKSEAIEILKTEYQSDIKSNDKSGAEGKQTNIQNKQGITTDDLLKMNPTELFKMGLAES